MLRISLTRTSPTHHQFAYERGDGTGESAELETKTYLKHDLTHFALESEANVKDGFFGLLAQGRTFAELADISETNFPTKEALNVERVVGPLSGVIENEHDPKDLLNGLENLFSAHSEPLPKWLTAETITKARERYRHINGHWNALPFGETLELEFGN